MIKYCTFPLMAAFFVGIAQAASADLPKPEPVEVIAKSSDSQFFLLNDDTAWFVIPVFVDEQRRVVIF